MSEYTLEIKQIVDYPRCRIYRQFVQTLIADRSIRVSGGSGLYYFVVLCAYANFRTSYKRIDGISYTIYPGEWIMSMDELSQHFRTRFRRQTLAALDELQKKDLISFLVLGHGKTGQIQDPGLAASQHDPRLQRALSEGYRLFLLPRFNSYRVGQCRSLLGDGRRAGFMVEHRL